MSISGLCFAIFFFARVPFLNDLTASQLHGVLTGSDLRCFQSVIFFHAFTVLLSTMIIQGYILACGFDMSVSVLRSALGSLRCRLFLMRLCTRFPVGCRVYDKYFHLRRESLRREYEELARVEMEDAELGAEFHRYASAHA